MRLKTKMLRKLISVLCAAVMATSGAVVSVGAVEIDEILNDIDNCDSSIASLKLASERIKEEKGKEVQKLNDDIMERERTLTYFLGLEKNGEVSKADCENLKNEIASKQAERNKISDECKKEIYDLDRQAYAQKKEKARLEKVLAGLLKEREKAEKVEKAEREVKKIANSFEKACKTLEKWAQQHNVNIDAISQDIQLVQQAYANIGSDFNNAQKVNAYKEAAKNCAQKMEGFKWNHQAVKAEVTELNSNFENVVKDFSSWAGQNNINDNDPVFKTIQIAREAYANIGNDFNNGAKINKYKTLATESIQKMKDFQANHNKQEEKEEPVTKMDQQTFAGLLAGNQHENNYRTVRGKKCMINETCGIHVLTNLKNVYDYMDGKREGFVQGFNNVIDNFLANGGNTNCLYAERSPGVLGQALSVTDFEGFLAKNKIGMHVLNFYEFVNCNEEAQRTKKSSWQVQREYKDNLTARIKSFLVEYMKGKNFAPIATIGGGHWTLLAQYDETTNMVLRLDSAPSEAKWVPLNTIAENFINVDDWGDDGVGFNLEMPIFTRTEGIKKISVSGLEEFTDQKQDELINSIR